MTIARELEKGEIAERLQPLEDFFSAGDARNDRWRALNVATHDWAVEGAGRADAQQRVVALFSEMAPVEDYWAYPGASLMRSLKESMAMVPPDQPVRTMAFGAPPALLARPGRRLTLLRKLSGSRRLSQ